MTPSYRSVSQTATEHPRTGSYTETRITPCMPLIYESPVYHHHPHLPVGVITLEASFVTTTITEKQRLRLRAQNSLPNNQLAIRYWSGTTTKLLSRKTRKTQALIQSDSSFDKTDEEFKWTEGEAQQSNGQFKTKKKENDVKDTRGVRTSNSRL